MKRHAPLRLLALPLLVLVGLSACSHAPDVKKYDYPMTTNANEEIDAIDGQIRTARTEMVDVLSPRNFAAANESLNDAKEARQDNKENTKILEKLGYARAYLDQANAVASQAKRDFPEVVQARQDALAANASTLFRDDLKDTDGDLEGKAKSFEKGDWKLSADDRTKLQKNYLDLELKSIQKGRLSEASANMDAADKMDAKKYAPKTLTEAKAAYSNAQAVIASNRHEESTIGPAVAEANKQSKYLVAVTETAKNSKGKSPEQIALDMEAAKKTIDEQEMKLSQSSRDMAKTKSELNRTKGENAKLSAQERINQTLDDAQKKFGSNEAEVYRQGDQLLIRLKGMGFSSGRSEIPTKSFDTLNKVKDVIASLGAEKVVVEGHTDSTGTKAVNQKLSDKRAKAVADYLVSQEAVPADEVVHKGYGFDKPIAPNKTKQGRAANRRVDLLITPSAG